MEGWLSKKSKRYGNWRRRYFAISPGQSDAELTIKYWSDHRKQPHSYKGLHVLNHLSQVFSIPPEGQHSYCFKVLAKDTELVVDAESSQSRMRWILAIESVVMDIIDAQQRMSVVDGQNPSNPSADIDRMSDVVAARMLARATSGSSLIPPPSDVRTGSNINQFPTSNNAVQSDKVVIESPILTAKRRREAAMLAASQLQAEMKSIDIETSSTPLTTTEVNSNDTVGSLTKSDDNNRDNDSVIITSQQSRSMLDSRPSESINRATTVAVSDLYLCSIAEKAIRSWMINDDTSFAGLVTEVIIHGSEFTVSAAGASDAWELKANTFFNPLGNFSISGIHVLRESANPILKSSFFTKSGEWYPNKSPLDSSGRDQPLSSCTVWCGLFVFAPVSKSVSLSTSILDYSLSGTGTGSSSNVSTLSPGETEDNESRQVLEEYEVQLTFDESMVAIRHIMFQRVDVIIRNEGLLETQRAWLGYGSDGFSPPPAEGNGIGSIFPHSSKPVSDKLLSVTIQKLAGIRYLSPNNLPQAGIQPSDSETDQYHVESTNMLANDLSNSGTVIVGKSEFHHALNKLLTWTADQQLDRSGDSIQSVLYPEYIHIPDALVHARQLDRRAEEFTAYSNHAQLTEAVKSRRASKSQSGRFAASPACTVTTKDDLEFDFGLDCRIEDSGDEKFDDEDDVIQDVGEDIETTENGAGTTQSTTSSSTQSLLALSFQQSQLQVSHGNLISPRVQTYIARKHAGDMIMINVQLPIFGAAFKSVGLNIMFGLDSTVEQLLVYMLSKMRSLGMTSLVDQSSDSIVLKITGAKDYLLHKAIPLYLFEAATNAFRSKEVLTLTMKVLSPADAASISRIVREDLCSVLDSADRLRDISAVPSGILSSAKETDLFVRTEASATTLNPSESCLTEGSLSDIVRGELPTGIDLVPKEDCQTSFCVRVHGIRLPDRRILTKFNKYYVEVNVLVNGSTMLEHPLRTTVVSIGSVPTDSAQVTRNSVPDGSNEHLSAESPMVPFDISIPMACLNTNLLLSNCPETARVHGKIFARSTRSNKWHQLGDVCVNVFDSNGLLNCSNAIKYLIENRRQLPHHLRPNSDDDFPEGDIYSMRHSLGIRGVVVPFFPSRNLLAFGSNLSAVRKSNADIDNADNKDIGDESVPIANSVLDTLVGRRIEESRTSYLETSPVSDRSKHAELSAVDTSNCRVSYGDIFGNSSISNDSLRDKVVPLANIPHCFQGGIIMSFDGPYPRKVIRASLPSIATVEADTMSRVDDADATVLRSISTAKVDKANPGALSDIRRSVSFGIDSSTFSTAPTAEAIRSQHRVSRRALSLVSRRALTPSRMPNPDEWRTLVALEQQDSLVELTPESVKLLWDCREACSERSRLLPKFLRAVIWTSAHAAAEARRMILVWNPCSAIDALELLDVRYSDPVVREYAVQRLSRLSDARLCDLLLQLVQVLKYEAYHDSPLARLLLRRALLSPHTVGHSLFWMLRSEMHLPRVCDRFGVILAVYLTRCGHYRNVYLQQLWLNANFTSITQQLKSIESSKRTEFAKSKLKAISATLPPTFTVSMSPRIECCGINIDRCFVLSSKKVPLWITLINADAAGAEYPIIFKVGDDLRQDQLTLQIFRFMESVWRGDFDDDVSTSGSGVENGQSVTNSGASSAASSVTRSINRVGGISTSASNVGVSASSSISFGKTARDSEMGSTISPSESGSAIKSKLTTIAKFKLMSQAMFSASSNNLLGGFSHASHASHAGKDSVQVATSESSSGPAISSSPPSSRAGGLLTGTGSFMNLFSSSSGTTVTTSTATVSDEKPDSVSIETSVLASLESSFTTSTDPGMAAIYKKWFEPLDLRLRPYGCCATAWNVGMIEVVLNSSTLATIQTDFGGKLTGAFASTTIAAYLHAHNTKDTLPQAVDNFCRSCAGYCVATYLLGIGDRHGDNIMVARSGHLFHIDFGHFLGNFKTKYGISRERQPFVFTPEMAYVLGGPGSAMFAEFESHCVRAFNILRKHGALLISLFQLMIAAGMPELLQSEDIQYLRDMLSLELTENQASEKFIREIKVCLNSVSRRIDNWIHNMKHKT